MSRINYKPNIGNNKDKKRPLEKALDSQGAGKFYSGRFSCFKCCRTFLSGYSFMYHENEIVLCKDCRNAIQKYDTKGSVHMIFTAMKNG